MENLQGAVAKDQASIDLAELNLEYCYVRSPNDGRTGRRLVDPGNYVATGGATLVNIQLQDPVYVDFTISENDLAQLRENMGQGNTLAVDVITPARPDIVKNGELSFLDNSVSTQSGTALLRATIPNKDRYLWPGQYVNVTLTLQILKGASVVPSQTVQMGGKGTYLFAVKPDNTVEQRIVTQGVRYQDMVVVSQGVKPGETVVVEGQLALGNGRKVNPKEYPGYSGTVASSRRFDSTRDAKRIRLGVEAKEFGSEVRASAMNFSELFIRRPIMTLLLTISITAFGIQVFRQLPVNDLPAVDYPVIQVSVTYPGPARRRWQTPARRRWKSNFSRSQA